MTNTPTFVDLLKEKYAPKKNIEIINASTPGYTTYQEVLFFKKYLLSLDPDVVLLSYCLNDNHIFLHRFDQEANMLWTDEAKKSLQIQSKYDYILNKSYFLLLLKEILNKNPKKQERLEYPWEDAIDFNIAWKDYSWFAFSKSLKNLKDMVEKDGGKLAVVIFPIELQLDESLVTDSYDVVTKPQHKLSYFCRKFGLECLDLFGVFYENDSKHDLYTDGVHLSHNGHFLSSEMIFNFLNTKLLK